MATPIDFTSLTLNIEEARSMAETVQESTYVRPEIKDAHGVMTGVEMDKYIPILGQFGLFGKVDPGSCGTNTESGQIPISQKQWAPKLVSFRIPHCQDDVPDLIKFWKKSRIAKNTWEDVDNEMMAFINDRASDAVAQSILRISNLANTTNSPVGDATGNELLTSGTDKTYFNMLNGMWAQIEADQAGSALSYRYTISENGEASKTAQLALADSRALTVFRSLYNNIDPRAFEGNLVFQVSRTLLNNWQDFMEDKSQVFQLDRTEKGSTKFSYRGIPIVVIYDWDRFITSYFDNGTTYYLPHRAVLTDLNNIPIGTSDEESMTSIDSFYDKKDKKWYLDVAYKIDQKNLLEYNMAVAY